MDMFFETGRRRMAMEETGRDGQQKNHARRAATMAGPKWSSFQPATRCLPQAVHRSFRGFVPTTFVAVTPLRAPDARNESAHSQHL
jgi:hypothetical protein